MLAFEGHFFVRLSPFWVSVDLQCWTSKGYKGIRCLSVHPSSVCLLSTFSNDISYEAEKLILFIFHIKQLLAGGTNNCVFSFQSD